MIHTIKSLFALTLFALTSCGGRPVEDPETWMLGTFSTVREGCGATSLLRRYVAEEDGTFRIELDRDGDGNDNEWFAFWERTGTGKFRIMRDEAFSDVPDYPIPEGTVLEVTRSTTCDAWDNIWHTIDRVELDTGDRLGSAPITPGDFCVSLGPVGCAEYLIAECEGAETPPSECE